MEVLCLQVFVVDAAGGKSLIICATAFIVSFRACSLE